MRRNLILFLLAFASLAFVSAQDDSAPQLMATTCVHERSGAEIEVTSPRDQISALIARLEDAGFSCLPPKAIAKALPTV